MTQTNDRFEVVITAFVLKKGKFLIIKRSPEKKRFPNRWTIPGGKLEVADFINTPKETSEYWYNVAEKALKREVHEETGLSIKTDSLLYVTSLSTVHEDGAGSFVLSFIAEYQSGEVALQPEECVEHAWVSAKEAEEYDLIDGILDEIRMAEAKLNGQSYEWQRH